MAMEGQAMEWPGREMIGRLHLSMEFSSNRCQAGVGLYTVAIEYMAGLGQKENKRNATVEHTLLQHTCPPC